MDQYAVNILGALAMALSDGMAERIASVSRLGPTAAAALVSVSNHPGEPVDALAKRLALTPAGATRLLDRLEAEHLVKRHVAAGDKRSRMVHPTAEGRRQAFQVLQARSAVIARVLAAFSPAEQVELSCTLQRLLAAIISAGARADHTCRLCDGAACREKNCPSGTATGQRGKT